MQRVSAAAAAALLTVLLAACSSPTTTPAPAPNAPAGAEPAVETVDAPGAVAWLVSAGIATDPATTTPENDPDELLGRPNGYLSRATFTIPGVEGTSDDPADCGRGGCIEQWADEASAEQRFAHLAQLGASSPLFVEHTLVRGDLVLRVVKAADGARVEQIAQTFLAG